MSEKVRMRLAAALALALVLGCIHMYPIGKRQTAYIANKSQLNGELSTAVYQLSTGSEADYNEALARFYGAYLIIDASPYFPEEYKDRAYSCFGLLCEYGCRFPEEFRACLPELLSLKGDLRSLGEPSGGDTEYNSRLEAVFDKLDGIVEKIGASLPE